MLPPAGLKENFSLSLETSNKRAGSSAAVYTNIYNPRGRLQLRAQTEPYNTLMSSLVDIEEWMRMPGRGSTSL